MRPVAGPSEHLLGVPVVQVGQLVNHVGAVLTHSPFDLGEVGGQHASAHPVSNWQYLNEVSAEIECGRAFG